jgi:hypothetical protein
MPDYLSSEVGFSTGMDTIATKTLYSGLPPGPKGTLIGGHIRHFGTDLLDFLLDTARVYGHLASLRQALHQALRRPGVQACARQRARYE